MCGMLMESLAVLVESKFLFPDGAEIADPCDC